MKLKITPKKGAKIAGLIGLGVIVAFFNVFVALLLIKFGWAKISVILFSGLVEKGDVNALISFKDAFIIAIIIYALKEALGTGIAKVNKGKNEK